MRLTDTEIKVDGYEKGFSGFPSSANPFPEDSSDHNTWDAAHRNGYWDGVDHGYIPNTL